MTSSGDSGGGDFDLNLAPIIDCFTVLITYLLVSASFISLSVLDVGVSAAGQADPSLVGPKEPPVSLLLELDASHKLILKVTGGVQNLDLTFTLAAAAKSGQWDLDALTAKLEEVKTKWPKAEDVSLSASPTVRYKDVVEVIDKARKTFPKIYLGG